MSKSAIDYVGDELTTAPRMMFRLSAKEQKHATAGMYHQILKS